MQFQKISIPTPWKVNGNSEGVRGLKGQNFKRKVWDLSGNSSGVGWGGLNQKTFRGRSMDTFWNSTFRVTCRILSWIFKLDFELGLRVGFLS